MKTSNVTRRYAQAFFDVAGEAKRYEDCYRELELFTSVMKENHNLHELLINPVFDKDDKLKVMDMVLRRLDLSLLTANFIRLLVSKRRISGIVDILEDYRKLMDEAIGIARVQVKTAFALTVELASDLQRKIESLTGKIVEMQIEEDRTLLGGVVVRIGDKLYDGSVKVQLNNMMRLLGEEI
ncbi:MAG: ATP synthase F1 subunit delta [Syntrophales bacterium]